MRRRLLLVLPLALGLAACSRCGKGAGGPTDLARALPKDAEVVLLVPHLGDFGQKVALLQRLKLASFIAQLQGFSTAEDYVSAITSQAGVDFRSKEALRKAGIDPDLGLGVALYRDGRAYSVLGVHDAKALKETVARLARDRLGASGVADSEKDGVRVVTFARSAGGAPELGLAFKDRLAFLAAGTSAAQLPAFAALAPEASMANNPQLAAGLQRLPAERDLWVHLPAEAPQSRAELLKGATFTARLAPDAVVVRADVPWINLRNELDVLTKKPGPDLFPVLPKDAFLVARFSGDPALLAPFLPYVWGHAVQRAVEETHFDVKAEVLDNLMPGAVASLSLAPEVKLAGGVPALDVRRTNPFRFVHLVAAAQVKDPAKAGQMLELLPPLATRVGATLKPEERAGHKVLIASYAQGEGTHVALDGKTLLLAAPEARLVEALGKVDTPAPGAPLADPELMKLFDERALALVVDLRRLSDSVKALPPEAWGVGGFAMKATTVRWLDATDDLKAITVGLSAKETALQAELVLRLTPP